MRFRRRPWRSLLLAAVVLLAGSVWAVTQPASAAQKNIDLRVKMRTFDSGGFTLSWETENKGPDTLGYEVIAWYSWVVEFPLSLTPRSNYCDQLEYEDRGPYTVGVCTRHGPNRTDLPLGSLGFAHIKFDGQPTICDSLVLTMQLDAALRDPSPVRETISFGVSNECG